MPSVETVLFPAVFGIFGIESLCRFGAWVFGHVRTYQDMKDAHEAEPEAPASKPSP